MSDMKFVRRNRFDEFTGWLEPVENPDASELAVVSALFIGDRVGVSTLFDNLGAIGFPRFFTQRATSVGRDGEGSPWVNAILPLEYADGFHLMVDRGYVFSMYTILETVRAENLRDVSPSDVHTKLDVAATALALHIVASPEATTKVNLLDFLESLNFQTISLLNSIYGTDMLRLNGDAIGREDRWVAPAYN